VSVKRTVHGYKKLSLITRAEISRTELSLPPMEYDTFGVWLDAGAADLMPVLGDRYGPGVHALSHAILAVAPLVSPGLCRSDLQCDHSFVAPTLVMLFDERAGGSGACQCLWTTFFQANGLVEAAIKLLEECSMCGSDTSYDGGCPECLHDSNCINFNMHLSRSAAIEIGKWILRRMQHTHKYLESTVAASLQGAVTAKDDGTPRRQARKRALRNAKDMHPARNRQIVVGRPSWPLDGDDFQGRQEHG
jgi:DEAD/DEAH box helicase domain-containing protein